MYSEVFCRVYDLLGWNYYPQAFGEQLLQWLASRGEFPRNALDLGCGTGVLCAILKDAGIEARGMDYSQGMVRIAREHNPQIPFDVGDMVHYRPREQFDLVTCTGDALNHIPREEDVARIFANVASYLAPGGWFLFDILNENEVSDSEPFELDFSDTLRVWFQMTRPDDRTVELTVRVYENGTLSFREVIRETLHDPDRICRMLEEAGLRVLRRSDSLLEDSTNHGTTWFLIARKPGE